jgi:beta-1,4-mannooligosaccharide/beta-1,4-mannosyl-N-acetylglucosamine phosphorylase
MRPAPAAGIPGLAAQDAERVGDGAMTSVVRPLEGSVPSTAGPIFPWEERPAGSNGILWRSSLNPVIPRDLLPHSNSIFNSAVVPVAGGFAGVFRVDDTSRSMNLHAGRSADGIDWRIDPNPIVFLPTHDRAAEVQGSFEFAYDPRVTWLEDRWYVSWCNGYHGPTIGIGYTHDFQTFHQLDNGFLPFNRNGVLFPRRISGRYAILTRPSDNGHTPFGDIFYSESPDLIHWGRHRHVMSPEPWTWQSTKIGAGPTPIETPEGWLLIYHGVLTSCNGFVYSMGAALLDLDEPWKVIARGRHYLLSPQVPYEQVGDVPNVVFPCAALVDEARDRITIYYGAADTVTCMAHGHLSEVIASVRG